MANTFHLGYYARGAKITLVVIEHDTSHESGVIVTDLITMDLSTRQGRIKNWYVKLKPRGIDTGPKSADDVKNAITCVLEALKVLHRDPKVYHRDIQWSNVMQNCEDPTQRFLIDWEEATLEPTAAAAGLCRETHAPQVFVDGHGAEVDIWGAGRLITTAGIDNLPEGLLSLGRRMMDGSIQSAAQAAEELKAI
ncbi:hypothetical protein AMATHDRAFT_40028 [Amanita thiersii Skay4041]|uniref:Protein kinase domain-containing protein n=1 Tax=Amanita thiersii Skay4041 TaxID=703135 RepID=A0A2A9NVA3_9AGAR|nr:hypothetical protein AMATHDRAFT_40028 [Amanita thiersii Skay4041]